MECCTWEAYARQFNITKLRRIVTGGATGQESIYNGLKAIKEDNEETKDIVIIVHDGNRPMLPQDAITDNLVEAKTVWICCYCTGDSDY